MLRGSDLNVGRAPDAPRAMAATSAAMLDENVQLLEYANLLFGLDPFQGVDPVEREDKRFGKRYTHKELYRSFLDSVSYLCDIHPQGGTVTAAALNQLQYGAILHLAANEGVPNHIRPFIEWVAKTLPKDVTRNNRAEKERILLHEAIRLGSQRMTSYQGKMRTCLQKCRLKLNEVFRNHRVRSWIENIENESDLHNLSSLCYNGREKELDELKSGGRQGNNSDFAELAHYIGRLGAHQYAVSTIITAALGVPDLRNIVDVKFIHSFGEETVALPQDAVDFRKVAQKLCEESCLRYPGNELYARLHDKDFRGRFALTEGLERRNTFKTRVHAELQVVDYFSRKKLKFFRGDKYVGCSKPACYLCYRYISLHHRGFSLPASHKKVILGWRAPDVNVNEDVNGNGVRIRREVCGRLKKEIVRDIEEHLRAMPHNDIPRHLSTNGSSRAPSLMTTILSLHR